MTTETPNTPPADAPAADSIPTVPPAAETTDPRVKALEDQLAAVADALAADVPEKFRALIPTALPVADRVKWLQDAKKTGLFATTVAVPPTDTGRIRPAPSADTHTLPPAARIAAGYR